ncbi:basic helix-loop-helix protein [Elasticomyces elasticus]|nr:basic helix-loop-helix protein [Elasticomyces elasticus]KAK3644551.1 basic helix-loop-helix protein [Elasticomyces elasticus]KAK4910403.1 basic helix-loop-helix protein [Elasticomyces elasticus]KAK5750068.1 basic helix-loop-helix protein [Elasticomyces elasticus]
MAMLTKRKRDMGDLPGMRPAPGMRTPGFDEQYMQIDDQLDDPNAGLTMAEMLAQQSGQGHDEHGDQHDHMHDQQSRGGMHGGHTTNDTAAAAMAQYRNMTIPQTTEQTFMLQANDASRERRGSSAADPATPQQQQTGNYFEATKGGEQQQSPNGDGGNSPGGIGGPPGGSKPAVGTDEWHKVRRDNHKEVERRRRETINEGINELAKIVPGCEKNKGSILARAVQFITQLKENETQNIEKWTLEKLLTEQAIAELSSSCDKMKAECARAWAECEQWKRAAAKAGAVEVGKEDAEGEEET